MNYLSTEEMLKALNLEPGDEILTIDAHPDDESMTRGEIIPRLIGAGIVVRAVTVTDGTNSTVGEPVWVQGGGRRLEAIRALWGLGVPLYRQEYFGMEDGALHTPANRKFLSERLGSLLTAHNFKLILTPGDGFDGHTDHIAVHETVIDTVKQLETAPDVWGVDAVLADFAIDVDSGAKLQRLADHASQFEGADQRIPPIRTIERLADYTRFLWAEGFTQYWPPEGYTAAANRWMLGVTG